MSKQLCVTTDFLDDVICAGRLPDKAYIDGMMAYSASLGAKRHEWVFDTTWSIYENYRAGFDLLKEVCDAAHRHGMRLDVVYKLFEGALSHPSMVLPSTMPRPEGFPLLLEAGGLVSAVRPFVAANPHMRLARMPQDNANADAPVAAIRLVKGDDGPASFTLDDLSLWTSAINGNGSFKRYQGPITWQDEVEWRHAFPPSDKRNRVITLAGLQLPADTRFIRIACKVQPNPTFRHFNDQLVELIDAQGNLIPSTHSQGKVNAQQILDRTLLRADLCINAYLTHPDVKAQFADRDGFLAQCKDMYRFETGGDTHCTLDGEGELVVMCGKPMHIIGALSPVYPEVRQHWLEDIRFCLDRGVDGVNIRMANHNRPSQPWAHGFNEPVLEQSVNPGNIAEAEKINGEAMTQFIADAASMVHGEGKELGVHVNAMMFQWDDKHGQPFGPIFQNIEYQWEKWITDYADYVEFRGAGHLYPQNLQRVIDRIGLVARAAGKDFIYQCTRGHHVVHPDGPHPTLQRELQWAMKHPDITVFNLYELANITQPPAVDGGFKGSEAVAQLIRENWG